MKKLMILALVVVAGLAFTQTASALENEFGGYYRVRAFTNMHFDGTEDDASTSTEYAVTADADGDGEVTAAEAAAGPVTDSTTTTDNDDIARWDSRLRLYYTGILNDDLKLVTKFEAENVFGDDEGGDVGADGDNFVTKNMYLDFNVGELNAKVGTQGGAIHRGLLFADDFSGATLGVGNSAFIFAKADEVSENAGDDTQFYTFMHTINTGNLSITPEFTYVDMAIDDSDGDHNYYAGVDIDMTMDNASVWASLIYQGGEQGVEDEDTEVVTDKDREAFLVALGGNVSVSDMVSVHGQAFHATGDDDANDDDLEAFTDATGGQSYYWAEIMGYGVFDAQASANSPADKIGNVTALNAGVTLSPMEKLSVDMDLWYAMLAEDDANGNDKLGTEVDVKATYELVEGLNLDLVGAYLFADDATYDSSNGNDDNPWEIGSRLSISF